MDDINTISLPTTNTNPPVSSSNGWASKPRPSLLHGPLSQYLGMRRPEVVPAPQPFHSPGRPLVLNVGQPGLLDTIHFIDDERIAVPLADDQVDWNQLGSSGRNDKTGLRGTDEARLVSLIHLAMTGPSLQKGVGAAVTGRGRPLSVRRRARTRRDPSRP